MAKPNNEQSQVSKQSNKGISHSASHSASVQNSRSTPEHSSTHSAASSSFSDSASHSSSEARSSGGGGIGGGKSAGLRGRTVTSSGTSDSASHSASESRSAGGVGGATSSLGGGVTANAGMSGGASHSHGESQSLGGAGVGGAKGAALEGGASVTTSGTTSKSASQSDSQTTKAHADAGTTTEQLRTYDVKGDVTRQVTEVSVVDKNGYERVDVTQSEHTSKEAASRDTTSAGYDLAAATVNTARTAAVTDSSSNNVTSTFDGGFQSLSQSSQESISRDFDSGDARHVLANTETLSSAREVEGAVLSNTESVSHSQTTDLVRGETLVESSRLSENRVSEQVSEGVTHSVAHVRSDYQSQNVQTGELHARSDEKIVESMTQTQVVNGDVHTTTQMTVQNVSASDSTGYAENASHSTSGGVSHSGEHSATGNRSASATLSDGVSHASSGTASENGVESTSSSSVGRSGTTNSHSSSAGASGASTSNDSSSSKSESAASMDQGGSISHGVSTGMSASSATTFSSSSKSETASSMEQGGSVSHGVSTGMSTSSATSSRGGARSETAASMDQGGSASHGVSTGMSTSSATFSSGGAKSETAASMDQGGSVSHGVSTGMSTSSATFPSGGTKSETAASMDQGGSASHGVSIGMSSASSATNSSSASKSETAASMEQSGRTSSISESSGTSAGEVIKQAGAELDGSRSNIAAAVEQHLSVHPDAQRTTERSTHVDTIASVALEVLGERNARGADLSQEALDLGSGKLELAGEKGQHGISLETLNFVSQKGLPPTAVHELVSNLGTEAHGHSHLQLADRVGASELADMAVNGFPGEKVAAIQEVAAGLGAAAGAKDVALTKLEGLELLKELEAPANAGGVFFADAKNGQDLALGVMSKDEFAKSPGAMGAEVADVKASFGELAQSHDIGMQRDQAKAQQVSESAHEAEAQMVMSMSS